MPSGRELNQSMWRGARIGAASLGLAGLITGISICVAYHLPFPPIAVTELGVILGGCLGAGAGYAWCFPSGRGCLQGCAAGAVVGLPIAGLAQGQVSLSAWLACLAVGCVLGHQAACQPERGPGSGWRLSVPNSPKVDTDRP